MDSEIFKKVIQPWNLPRLVPRLVDIHGFNDGHTYMQVPYTYLGTYLGIHPWTYLGT